MRNAIFTAVCIAAGSLAAPPDADAQTYAERIVTGYGGQPLCGAYAPAGPDRLFVGTIWSSPGRIDVVDLATRTVLPTPFLEIPDVYAGNNEQGLLGITFDPDYATNGYFYVDFTGSDNSINVRRYRVLGDPATSSVADPTSEYTVLILPKTAFWHNAGWIDFGPRDGYLYISIGDPYGFNAQDITDNLEGKILRVDVRGDDFPEDEARNFAIPPDNPFVGAEGDDAIWAYGLRNPFRASFDRLTGDLWINDTGEARREEVNYQPGNSPGGVNYGWPIREGSITGPSTYGGPPSPDYADPIYDYDHSEPDPLLGGFVISAGGFYRGPVDAFYGHYFFSDFGSQNIWKLDPDAVDPRASVTNVNAQLIPDAGILNRVPTFAEDAAGNLYLMDFDNPPDGDVFRVATRSKQSIWNGDDAVAGTAGDGTSWDVASNWTRDGVVDTPFAPQDSVVFAAGSSQPVIDLAADRTVAAVTFQTPYTLRNHTLQVLSGNIFVESNITATIESALVAESANHSIRKLGDGTVVINGRAGQIAVKEGTLAGSGTVEHLTVRDGATVAPGASVGILMVEDSFTMYPQATLEIELGGDDNSDPLNPQFDQLRVGSSFAAAGTLKVSLINGFLPTRTQSFKILDWDTLSGEFSQLVLPALPLEWDITKLYATGVLTIVVPHALPGDYDGSGVVDAADYIVWRKSLGSSSDLAADGNGDGLIDQGDYQIWQANFGSSQSSASTARRGVPEPGSGPLLFLALLHCIAPFRQGNNTRREHPAPRGHGRQ